MKLMYYSWISENLCIDQESMPASLEMSVYDLLSSLKAQSIEKNNAFSKIEKIYVAINGELLHKEDFNKKIITDADTISFFPAVSGG